MEDPYTNREIIEKFDYIKQSLCRIEKQTTKTTLRVDDLEDRNNYARGAIKVATIAAMVILVPILGWLIYNVAHLDDNILRVVKTILLK